MPATDNTTHRFQLQQIELLNYRCFRALTVDFDERLTVLTARNGAGKTAVLDAIAVAFGAFVGRFYTGRDKSITHTDVHLCLTRTELKQMEPQYPATLYATGCIDGEPIAWARALRTPKAKTTIKEARPLTLIGDRMQQAVTKEWPMILPLVAYYGTGRLWHQKKRTEKKVFESTFYSRTAGYQDCLDPASSYKYCEDWFTYADKANTELRMQYFQKYGRTSNQYRDDETPYFHLLSAIQNAVNRCMRITEWRNLHYSFKHRALVMEHPLHGILEVNQLSDGIRNMIALVADIAHRMVRLNSDFGHDAVLSTPGLVLIDEVDMHLHPEWQQVVLHDLTAAFPKLQFIVTTHSPQVLSTVKREQIRLLSKNIDGKEIAAMPEARTYGRSNADVLETVMAVSPEPNLPEKQDLRRYLQLVEQGDWRSAEVADLRKKLVAVLGPDHPSLLRADMIIRRREALEKR